jgi:hypothetical protein
VSITSLSTTDHSDADGSDADSSTVDEDTSTIDETAITQQLLEFAAADAPTMTVIRQAQVATKTHAKSFKGRPLHKCSDGALAGLWVDKDNRVYVPDTMRLRLRLFVVAHQGLGGHRGIETTIGWLRDTFCWEGMVEDVHTMVKGCLHCQRVKGSGIEPRPWGQIPKADGPNQVIHFDYLFIRATDSDDKPEYVLVMIDGFSRYVMLTAHKHANAENVVQALLQWFSLFGIVKRWVSDQGRHFLNAVLTQTRNHLGTEHHFTAAYAPWSNGLVERVNKEVVAMLQTLVSEARIDNSEWPRYLPVINFMLNRTPSAALGGKTPFTAFIGREPDSPLDVVYDGTTKTVVTTGTLDKADIKSKIADIRKSLDAVVREVKYVPRRKPPKRRREKLIDFDIGDYVLVSKTGRRVKDKTTARWDGPAVIVDAVSPKVYEVKHLLTGKKRPYHVDFIRRYADKTLQVTTQLKNFVAAASIVTNIRDILDHRCNGSRWELLVTWQGFDDEESTWQDLEQLYEDASELVVRYIKTVEDKHDQESLREALSL